MSHALPLAAVIGGGPAGLMAAETLAAAGRFRVEVFDAMPSVGRKFLMAGKGGMNITHSEDEAAFLSRYGTRSAEIEPLLSCFGPADLRRWLADLGIETFVGTSGRVFPVDMKAAPLLRAWLHRLRANGVAFHVRHRWQGWSEGGILQFTSLEGTKFVAADVVVLAMGGGSWRKLGSDGAWVPVLREKGVSVADLRPANCGFDLSWSEYFRSRFAGHPVKTVAAVVAGQRRQGEFNITQTGIEGGLIYAVAAPLRDILERDGSATLLLDLAPARTREQLAEALARPRGRDSLANHLRRRAGIDGVKAGLLREIAPTVLNGSAAELAAMIKSLPLQVNRTRPLDEAISSAGGVRFEALDERLMLRESPGVFCAGEMLDWEAPTGGYLLTACFASGRVAGLGARAWLEERASASR